jgi:hypothetical protein
MGCARKQNAWNKEDAREINALIDNLNLKLNKIYSKLIENNEIITANRIKDIFLGKDIFCEFLKHQYNITDMHLQQIQYSFVTAGAFFESDSQVQSQQHTEVYS